MTTAATCSPVTVLRPWTGWPERARDGDGAAVFSAQADACAARRAGIRAGLPAARTPVHQAP
ncbi:hypothetical protein [Streptomyces sp. NPDC001774]